MIVSVKRYIVPAVLIAVVGVTSWMYRGMFLQWFLPGQAPNRINSGQASQYLEGEAESAEVYQCPMHPQVVQNHPDDCPSCGMELVLVEKTAPPATQPVSQPASLQTVPGSVQLTPWKQQLIGVTTAQVERRPMEKPLRTVGRVVYDETKLSDVNLKITGWIQKLYADYTGKLIEKGQPLFDLYSPELVSTQEEYILALETLEKLRRFVTEEETALLLSNPSGYPVTAALVQKEAIQKTESLVSAAKRRLLLWDLTEAQILTLREAGEPQTFITIYSPSTGVVVEKMAVEGMYVNPGMQLYRIADLSTIWVYADLYEYELALVREGLAATMTLSYNPGRTFEGNVDYIYPYLETKTRTAKVRLIFPNLDLQLRPGMYVNVGLKVDLGEQIAVPESSVLYSGRRRIVFVDVGSGRFQPREVTLGAKVEDYYHVLAGVEDGERVVTSGNFLIDSESKLKSAISGMASQYE